MLFLLLKHQLLRATRSDSFGRSLFLMAVMLFFGIFILGYIIALAFSLESIMREMLDISDPVAVLNKFLIYYFFSEIISRYFLQKLPGADIDSYLHLPIKRSTVTHYLLGKSFLSPFNIIVPILFAPFAFSAVQESVGLQGAIGWYFTLVFLSWSIHYGLIWLRRKAGENLRSVILIVIVIGILAVFEYYGLISFGSFTEPLFVSALQGFVVPIILLGVLIGCYYLSYKYYLNNSYQDELSSESSEIGQIQNIGFLDNFGTVGDLINTEIKLIIRHKRPRNSVFLCFLFLFYGLLFYPDMEDFGRMNLVMMIFLGIFITGIFILQYGQFLMSWHSNFFDFFSVNPITSEDYIASRFYLLSAVSLFFYVLSVPYVYFGWQVLLVNTAMLLYNIGINTFVIIRLSLWGPQKIDLKGKSAFSFQGIGAAQWVMGIPLLFGPILLFVPFAVWGTAMHGIIFLGILGLLGLIFRNSIIHYCAIRLQKARYSISASFRSE